MDLQEYLDKLSGKEKTYIETLLFKYKKQTDIFIDYEYISLNEIINTIRSETLLECLCNKPSLPSFNPSTTDNGLSGLIHFDIDLKDNDFNIITLIELRKKIRDYHYTVYEFKSPNGGVKFAVYTDIKTSEKYENAYDYVKTKIINDLDLDIVFDDAVGSVGKTCFLSADKNVYFNNDPKRLEIEEKTKCKETKQVVFEDKTYSPTYIKNALGLVPKNLRYHERLPFNTAVLEYFGSDGIELLINHWNKQDKKKLRFQLETQLKHIKKGSIGYLIKYAKENGLKEDETIIGKARKKQKPEYLYSLNDNRKLNDEIFLEMKDCFISAIRNKKSTLIQGSLGSGKTKLAIDIMKECNLKFIYLVKSHSLAIEMMKELDANHIKGKVLTCENQIALDEYNNNIPSYYCNKLCPFKTDCQYIKQFNDDRIRIMTHNELFKSSKFNYWIPDVIIIDEDIISFDKDVGSDLFKIINKEIETKSDIERVLLKYKMDIINTGISLFNDISNNQMEYNKDKNLLLYHCYMFLLSGNKDYLNNVMFSNKRLIYIKKKEIQERYRDVTKILLDGTTEELVIKQFIGELDVRKFLFNKNDVYIKQIYNSTLTKNYINNNKDITMKGFRKLFNGYNNVGFIGYKEVSFSDQFPTYIKNNFDNVNVVNHLGNIRGSNEFNNVDALFVLRYSTPVHVLNEYAFALFGSDYQLDLVYKNQLIYYKNDVYSISNSCYSDPIIELMRKHFDVGETLQAVNRSRMIYGCKKDVVLLSNVSLGPSFPVDEWLDFDDYFSKKEHKVNSVEINETAFVNSKAELMRLGYSKWYVENNYDLVVNDLVEKGYQLKRVVVKNKNRIKSNKEIWCLSDRDFDDYLSKHNFKLV